MRLPYLILLVILVNVGCSRKPIQVINRASVQTQPFKQTIPYSTIKRVMIVKMKLKNNRTYRFLWDTGAAATVINRKVANELGLKAVSSMKVVDSRQKSRRQGIVNLGKVEIAGVKFKNIAAFVIDFPEESVISCYADGGIIGANIISRCNWTIDYETQQLTLTNSPFNLHKNTKAIPFKTNFSGKMYFQAQLMGNTINNVLFDSGSSGGLDLNFKFGLKTGILKKFPSNKLIDGTTQGIYGTRIDTTYLSMIDSLKLGSQMKSGIPVEFGKLSDTKVGNRVLQNFKVHIDFAHKHLLLEPRNAPFESRLTFGVLFKRATNGKVSIGSLFQPSYAAQKGLKVGDEIIAIDDQPVKTFFKDKCHFYDWQFKLDQLKQIKLTLTNKQQVILEQKPLALKFWWSAND
ncbi:hypothetical protein BKI52_18675 [marine bacterium AO1-C]|nr:hypothetical protein BKI52_18675 [marine bacterium AO1-C]